MLVNLDTSRQRGKKSIFGLWWAIHIGTILATHQLPTVNLSKLKVHISIDKDRTFFLLKGCKLNLKYCVIFQVHFSWDSPSYTVTSSRVFIGKMSVDGKIVDLVNLSTDIKWIMEHKLPIIQGACKSSKM
jgi:hypothetical protein